MFIKRFLLFLAMLSLVLFCFSFGAIPETENYTGLVVYRSDFMIGARWYFLWFCISTAISFLLFGLRKPSY